MEVESLCFSGSVDLDRVLRSLVMETTLVAHKSVVWLLLLIGSLPNDIDLLPKGPIADERFLIADLKKMERPETENKDHEADDDDEDDDDDDDDDEDDDDDDNDDDDDDEDDDDADSDDDVEANGDGGSDDEDDDDDDDDDDGEEDDEENEDDDDEEGSLDEEEKQAQPPPKKKKKQDCVYCLSFVNTREGMCSYVTKPGSEDEGRKEKGIRKKKGTKHSGHSSS